MDTMTIDRTAAEHHRAAEHTTTPTTTPAATKPRTTSTISGGVVTLTRDGTETAFDMAGISSTGHAALAAHGLRVLLIGADDPAARYAELVAGKTPGRVAAAAKELDPWRLAYAHTLADESAKRDSVKTFGPGGKAHTPEYAMLLDNAKQRSVALDKAGLAKARVIPAVAVHYARLVGTAVSASSLLPDYAPAKTSAQQD